MASTSSSGHAEFQLIDDGMNHEPDSSNVPDSIYDLKSKHKVFLSHSGAQKDFVEQLCVDLERRVRYPFFDRLRRSLPIGEKFPKLSFDAIKQCQVGVVVLSEEFFWKSKWPMLELNAMVKESEKPNPCLIIIPVFYLISVNDLKNSENHERWKSQWEEWAMKDKRINVEEWRSALRSLGAIRGLEMKESKGDVKFRKEIVDEVCKLVPPATRWDDSHVQGRARLCKVIEDKMYEVLIGDKICKVGLYGVGGIGKTTIGKALCNRLSHQFHDNVCHIEFGSGSEMDLLNKVLGKFTMISDGIFKASSDICEGFSYFKQNLPRQPIFLVVDNVQDNLKSIEDAQMYMNGKYVQGSIILVTACSIGILKKLYLDETRCLEMPELVEEEAKALFLDSIPFCSMNDIDEVLVKNSIKRCFFSKCDGKNRHYHPLALKMLGRQIDSNPTLWATQLKKIDTFNQYGVLAHPVFSILRNSFDSLKCEHQLVFIDLALILHGIEDWPIHWSILDWLCMVHEETIEDMKDVLSILRRKSLLDDLDGEFTKIGIHDLSHEFAILETMAQDFKNQRWVYQIDENRSMLQRSGQWKECVGRMCFNNWGWRGLDGLNLVTFENLVVFSLTIEIHIKDCSLDLDMNGLKHLKSIFVYTPGLKVRAKGISSSPNLVDLLWCTPSISPRLKGIGCLTNLRYLKIADCKKIKVLDFTRLKLLQVVKIEKFPNLIFVRGFSSRLAYLQVLNITYCNSLQQCLGLGELHALEILHLCGCMKLKKLPYLGQLIYLRDLNIAKCKSLKEVPGLSDLDALEKFDSNGCSKLRTLLDLMKLTKLQVLNIEGCPIHGMEGLDSLTNLTTLSAFFTKVSKDYHLFAIYQL